MLRAVLMWGVLAAAVCVPVIAAASSPLLQWRDPIYIFAGLAGVVGMALLLMQPLLIAGALPGLSQANARKLHRATGALLLLAVAGHVVGLWITSPPDVIDVLLFRSPAPFAIWGALAMWAVFAAGLLAVLRPRLPLRAWRWGHTAAVSLAALGTVVHALQIVGTMEMISKTALSALVLAALAWAIARRRVWSMGLRPRRT